MGSFITGQAFLGQDEYGLCWYTLHNQLYLDDDGELYFIPRYFETDGYTIPKCLAVLGGDKMEWDIRPAIQHDFECRYHKAVKVVLSLNELRKKGIIREIEKENKNITICENIALEYLKTEDVNFNQANNRFKRTLKASKNIKTWRVNMMRFAVNFNLSWVWSIDTLDMNKFYKEMI